MTGSLQFQGFRVTVVMVNEVYSNVLLILLITNDICA